MERLGGDFKEVRFLTGLLDEFIVWEGGVKEDIFMIVLSGGVGGWGGMTSGTW